MTNSQLRRHNSLLRKNLRIAINCSSENEVAQQRINEMEELVFASESMKVMFDSLITYGRRIFEMSMITASLDTKFRGLYPEDYHEGKTSVYLESNNVFFIEKKKLSTFFSTISEPLIRGPVKKGEETFFPDETAKKVRSEALLPLVYEKDLIGVVAFGSANPGHFQDGQGPLFLKRLSRAISLKMAIFHASNGCLLREDTK